LTIFSNIFWDNSLIFADATTLFKNKFQLISPLLFHHQIVYICIASATVYFSISKLIWHAQQQITHNDNRHDRPVSHHQ